MGTTRYNKLVRDKIPEIIIKNGSRPITRILEEKEYTKELVEKLKEEVAEFEADHSVEELADIKEVMIAIREALGVHAGELEDVWRKKPTVTGDSKSVFIWKKCKSEQNSSARCYESSDRQ